MNESVSVQNNGLRTYRPPLDKYIYPSEDFKSRVQMWLTKLPSGEATRALMLSGPPGLGKTTLALALCDALGVDKNDIREINGANQRGIDDARDLISSLTTMPMMGGYRVIILDEIQQLTPQAQQALLTPIEQLPDSTIFIACTSSPENLNTAFRSRFYEIRLQKYSEEQIIEALENLPVEIPAKNLLVIAQAANGNMRRAIDLAEGGMGPENQDAIRRMNAIEMFYPLLMNYEWATMVLVLDQVTEQEKRHFFDRVLTLLEGTWMTLVGQRGALQMSDQRLVTDQIAKIPQTVKKEDVRKFVGRCYRDLAALQEKPIASVKGWVMVTMP